MKPLFIFFTVLLVSYQVAAQTLHFGGTLNLGVSKITSANQSEARYRPSGNLGVFVEKDITAKTMIGMNMLWVRIEARDKGQQDLYTVDPSTHAVVKGGTATFDSRLHANYLGIPAYFRFHSSNFGLKIGLQALLFAHARAETEITGTLYGQPYYAHSKAVGNKLTFFDWGPKVGLDYQTGQHFRINLDYYYGVSHTNSALKSRQNRQATLGVSYQFL